jgi:hypothetical protein
MVKSMVQVVLIVLRKTVERMSSVAHAFLYLSVMLAFIDFNYRTTTFNYDRIWLWTLLSLIAAFYGGALASLNLLTIKHVMFIILLFLGWVLIIGVGALVQKKRFPSMLVSRKGVNVNQVFAFAFRRANDESMEVVKSKLYYLKDRPITFQDSHAVSFDGITSLNPNSIANDTKAAMHVLPDLVDASSDDSSFSISSNHGIASSPQGNTQSFHVSSLQRQRSVHQRKE